MATLLNLKNYSDGELTVTDGTQTLHVPQGGASLLLDSPATVTRSDTSNFEITMDTTKAELIVGKDTYRFETAMTFHEAFGIGMSLGIGVMFVLIALRMVKQLGYHSQDV